MANDDFLVPSDVDLSTLCGIDQDVVHKGSILRAFACLSMAAYLYLFWMYFVVKTPVLRRHPTRLAIYGCLIEMGYFQQYLWLPTVGRDYLYNDDAVSEPFYCTSSRAASWWAFVTQFCTIGVQLCFLIISVDLRLAYTNPFSSFKHNKLYFASFVILGSLFTALCLLAMGPRVYGYDEHGIVWIQDSRASLAMNWPKFMLYYLIVTCIYIYSLWANFQFYRSSEKGLSVTISNRLSIMQRSKRFVLGHISVDIFILALEFLSFISAGDEGILLALPAYLQALRGVLGLLVVLYSNSEDITWQSMNPFLFRLTADKTMVEKVALEGLLQQPHLNTALRAEILYFSTQGIMFAARNFERSGGLYGDSVEYGDEEVGGHSAGSGQGDHQGADMYEFEEHPTEGIRPSLVIDESNGVRGGAAAANGARQARQAAAGAAGATAGDHAGPALSAFLRAQDERVQAEREEAFLESVAYFGLPRESISFRGADVRHNSSSAAHSPYAFKAPRPASTRAANTAYNARSSLSASVHIDTRNPLAAGSGAAGVRGSEVEMRPTGAGAQSRQVSRDTVDTQATVKWPTAQDVEYSMGGADNVANNRRDSWHRISRTSALKLKDDRLASADSDFSGRSHSSSAVAMMKRTLHNVLTNAQSMFNPAFKEFRFKDFSPGHFAKVREMCSLTADQYSRSFEATCKETFSEGRSGAFMFFSSDQRCIAKSTSKAELLSLLKLMPEYVEYLTNHPNSLITRFIGAHCITMYGVELYFVVMLNCFPPHRLSERYDLKGSWVNRHALTKTEFKGGNKKKGAVKSPMLYLDNDLQHKLSLQPGIAQQVAEQIFKDVEFLSSHKKMDYSLLVGVKRERFEVVSAAALAGGGDPTATEFRESRLTISAKNGRITDCSVSAESYRPSGIPAGSSAASVTQTKAGTGKALRVVSRSEDEQIDPEDDGGLHTHYVEGPAKYYLGIIDVLQEWTLSKQLERAAKVFLYRYDPDGISAMNPADYAKRFLRKCVLETFEGLEEARPTFASGLSHTTADTTLARSAAASYGGSAAE